MHRKSFKGSYNLFTVSDMLMGLYLFIVALADIIFRGNYYQTASTWMSSWFCTFLGILAMTSLEVFRINREFVLMFMFKSRQLFEKNIDGILSILKLLTNIKTFIHIYIY